MNEIKIKIPKAMLWVLQKKARYKVAYGGRGSAKSHSFARALIIRSLKNKIRILCTREFQNSIGDSVHKLLSDLISEYNLEAYFYITKNTIRNIYGSEFIFKGLKKSMGEIKSTEAIDICWVEEAEKVSKSSWDDLIPTIRKEDSEIWISFNPDLEDSETYQRFVVNPPEDSIVRLVNYTDNPVFPEVLRKEMEWDKKTDYNKYENVWLGKCKNQSDAQIFKDKYTVESFDEPNKSEIYQNRFFFGADWGFSNDPTTLNRSWIKDKILYIDYEAWGIGVELEEIPQLFDSVPESRKWPIKADCSRPETISFVKRHGFNISGAPKWTGCVEDRIEYLKSFRKIVIHPRCVHTADEFKFYSFKTDKNTGEVLPIIIDKHNHNIDGIGYSLSDYIKKKVLICEVC